MKAISSAIVVAVGMYGLIQCLYFGALPSGSTGLSWLIAFLGSMTVTAFGLVGWWASLKYDR
jgi:hypothetical protein